MPRVHFIKKARKNYPQFGIKKGDSYFSWKFRYGGERKSLTRPKQSQLTQSPFLSEAYSIQEEIAELTLEQIKEGFDVSEYVDRIRELGSNAEDSLSNMPDQLQQAPTGELLQNRADAMEEWASELEGVDCDIDKEGFEAEAASEAEDEIGDPISWEENNPDDIRNYGDVLQEKIDELVDDKMDEKAQEILDELCSACDNAQIE